jgi:hypothetical protein
LLAQAKSLLVRAKSYGAATATRPRGERRRALHVRLLTLRPLLPGFEARQTSSITPGLQLTFEEMLQRSYFRQELLEIPLGVPRSILGVKRPPHPPLSHFSAEVVPSMNSLLQPFFFRSSSFTSADWCSSRALLAIIFHSLDLFKLAPRFPPKEDAMPKPNYQRNRSDY